jgi:hypothetical protein
MKAVINCMKKLKDKIGENICIHDFRHQFTANDIAIINNLQGKPNLINKYMKTKKEEPHKMNKKARRGKDTAGRDTD